jgi:UDP-glucose 4-epimerase
VKILVTGAHGFIGTALLPRLKDRNVTVVLFEGDVRDISTFPTRCDIVIHLAARAGREDKSTANLEAMRTNVLGTLAVAEYAHRFSCGVVFTSTCAVYEGATRDSFLKEDSQLAPRGTNGLSKLLAEEVLRTQANLHGFPAIILRLFNPYGPGQPRGYLVADVLHSIEVGEPIRLRNPSAVLDLVHVDDVSEAICRAFEKMPTAGVRVFNIGTGEATRVPKVAESMLRLAGIEKQLIDRSAPGEELRVVADPSAAERDLGWRPAVDLMTGLAATLTVEKNR